MKALSVRAPWWWWILYGGKDIENRSRRTHYRGPILIHASTWWHLDEVDAANAAAFVMYTQSETIIQFPHPGMSYEQMRALGGHIVGRADIVDCIPPDNRENPWHIREQWGWQLANVRPIRPFPAKGALGLFNVDYLEAA